MKITNVTYDYDTKAITLQGTASPEDAIAFLVGGMAAPAAATAAVTAAETPKARVPPGRKPKLAPVVEETEEEDDDTDDEDEDEDEDDEDEDKEEPAKPAKGKTNLKITPKMKSAAKLREVIEALIEQGVDKGDMVAACKALKDKVPVLSRVADLEARVPKAYEMVVAK